MYLVDTTKTPAKAVTISNMVDAAIFGDAFTADGKFAMAQKGAGVSATYDLTVADVAGGTTRTITTATYVELAYGTASKIVFDDGWDVTGGVGPNGSADVWSLDLGASGAAPVEIAVGAEADLFLDSTRTKLIYSSAANAGSEGIYVYTLP
jgi:hypothetical protein